MTLGVTLLDSPAMVMQQAIINASLGTLPTVPQAQTTPWPVYCSLEPDAPDNVVTVYDQAGQDDGREMIIGDRVIHYGIMVKFRAVDHPTGFPVAQAMADWIDRRINQMLVATNAATYVIWNMSRKTDVVMLGRDVPRTQRSLFSISATAAISRVA
jgi:hypothetical protein